MLYDYKIERQSKFTDIKKNFQGMIVWIMKKMYAVEQSFSEVLPDAYLIIKFNFHPSQINELFQELQSINNLQVFNIIYTRKGSVNY